MSVNLSPIHLHSFDLTDRERGHEVRDDPLTREQALERCGLSAEEFDELCERLKEERKS